MSCCSASRHLFVHCLPPLFHLMNSLSVEFAEFSIVVEVWLNESCEHVTINTVVFVVKLSVSVRLLFIL